MVANHIRCQKYGPPGFVEYTMMRRRSSWTLKGDIGGGECVEERIVAKKD
jgi:hypothetical protein